jgi:hypothetical protein
MASAAREHVLHIGAGEDPPGEQSLVEKPLDVAVSQRG